MNDYAEMKFRARNELSRYLAERLDLEGKEVSAGPGSEDFLRAAAAELMQDNVLLTPFDNEFAKLALFLASSYTTGTDDMELVVKELRREVYGQ